MHANQRQTSRSVNRKVALRVGGKGQSPGGHKAESPSQVGPWLDFVEHQSGHSSPYGCWRGEVASTHLLTCFWASSKSADWSENCTKPQDTHLQVPWGGRTAPNRHHACRNIIQVPGSTVGSCCDPFLPKVGLSPGAWRKTRAGGH